MAGSAVEAMKLLSTTRVPERRIGELMEEQRAEGLLPKGRRPPNGVLESPLEKQGVEATGNQRFLKNPWSLSPSRGKKNEVSPHSFKAWVTSDSMNAGRQRTRVTFSDERRGCEAVRHLVNCDLQRSKATQTPEVARALHPFRSATLT
jgi:hypothetical protein